jgi:hypothetical protein
MPDLSAYRTSGIADRHLSGFRVSQALTSMRFDTVNDEDSALRAASDLVHIQNNLDRRRFTMKRAS